MYSTDKYLEILGLDKSFKNLTKAEQERALTVAWRKFSRKWHPDINKSPNAEKMFKLGNEANEKLKECIKSGSFESYNEEKEENNNYNTSDFSNNNDYRNNYWEKFAENNDDSSIIFKKAAASVAIILIALFLILKIDSNIAYADNQAEAEYSEIEDNFNRASQNTISSSFDSEEYVNNVFNVIKSNWVENEKYKNVENSIMLYISKDGTLADRFIEISSGNDDFDNDMISLIDASAPFKPLPDEYKDDVLAVSIKFWHN